MPGFIMTSRFSLALIVILICCISFTLQTSIDALRVGAANPSARFAHLDPASVDDHKIARESTAPPTRIEDLDPWTMHPFDFEMTSRSLRSSDTRLDESKKYHQVIKDHLHSQGVDVDYTNKVLAMSRANLLSQNRKNSREKRKLLGKKWVRPEGAPERTQLGAIKKGELRRSYAREFAQLMQTNNIAKGKTAQEDEVNTRVLRPELNGKHDVLQTKFNWYLHHSEYDPKDITAAKKTRIMFNDNKSRRKFLNESGGNEKQEITRKRRKHFRAMDELSSKMAHMNHSGRDFIAMSSASQQRLSPNHDPTSYSHVQEAPVSPSSTSYANAIYPKKEPSSSLIYHEGTLIHREGTLAFGQTDSWEHTGIHDGPSKEPVSSRVTKNRERRERQARRAKAKSMRPPVIVQSTLSYTPPTSAFRSWHDTGMTTSSMPHQQEEQRMTATEHRDPLNGLDQVKWWDEPGLYSRRR
jgi:hypothetical protein